MPEYRTLNKDFFKKWSPEMAYVLGYFAADGSMLRNGRGAYFIEFTSTDRTLISLVQNAVASSHSVTARRRGGNTKTAYRLQIGSKDWYEDLCFLGFSQAKSKVLRFPRVPKTLDSHFVRGYFDGDGSVYLAKLASSDRKNKRWVFLTLFTSGSRSFLLSLWSLLKKHGVQGGSLRRKGGGFDLSFSHRDSLALYRFMYHTAEASELFLPRKREKLERAVKTLRIDR